MNPPFAQPDWMRSSSTANAAFDGDFRCPIVGRSLIEVSGRDAAAFLHSQFSTDIHAMGPADAPLSSYSDAKGRLLAILRVLRTDAGFLLELPADRGDAVVAQLQRYVLRAAVELRDVSADYCAFGVTGAAADSCLERFTGDPPPITGQCLRSDEGLWLVPSRGPRRRWLILGPADAVRRVWEACAELPVAPPEWWDLLEIEAGVPAIHEATAGRFVAQMVNLDRLDALDFHKGCYPGQEVIARTRYLGRVKRRMYPLRAGETAEPPRPGERVFAAGEDQPCGEIVRAGRHPDGGSLALAVLRVDSIDAPLVLADGTPAARLAPPYPLDEAA